MKKYLKSLIPLTMIVILLFPITVYADSGDWTPPSQAIRTYPLPYGKDIYNLSYPSIAQLKAKSSITPNTDYYAVFYAEGYTTGDYAGEYEIIVKYFNTDTVQVISNGTTNISASDELIYGDSTNIAYINWGGSRDNGTLIWNPTTETLDNRRGYQFGYSTDTYISNIIDTTTNPYTLKENVPHKYLIYTNVDFVNDQGNSIWGESTTPPPTTEWDFTHAKGGFESAYQDLSDLPDVDDTPPSDPTSNSAWYQKILNGMKQMGRNFLAGTLLITQTMHNDIEGLVNGTKDIGDILRERFAEILAEFGLLLGKTEAIRQLNQEQLDAIEDANAKSDPDTISTEWNAGYNASTIKGMVDTGQALKTSLGSIGTRSTGRVTFGAWRLEYNGNDLHLIGNYTLPNIFGGGTHQQDLSFAWYNNCREWVIWTVKAFFYVGFAWYLLHQVPNMIQGTGTTFRNISKGGKE